MIARSDVRIALRSVCLAALPLVVGGCVFLRAALGPDVALPVVSLAGTPEELARGAYLGRHVAACLSCHAERDWRYFSAPPTPGTEGKGGERLDRELGFPGVLVASNITPAALGSWSDAEVARAIAGGVSRDGEALFPVMNYPAYGKLAKSDLAAVIAWMRSLDAVPGEHPPRELDAPLGFLVNAFPREPTGPDVPPAPGEPGYGAYLAEAAGCSSCHTPVDDRGRPLEGEDYAGGREIIIPKGFGTLRSPNLTPDRETGLGAWTRELFIARFRSMTEDAVQAKELAPGDFQSVMPWTEYSGMTEDDLGAIYDYLRTLPPRRNLVNKFTPPEGALPRG